VFAVAVHEMAHVAVDRARMRSGKSAPVDAGLFPWRRDLHGEIFCRAFEALIRRTEVDFGASSEIIVRLRLELNRYRLAQVQDLDEIADGWFWSGW
jgi:hypothetical protein